MFVGDLVEAIDNIDVEHMKLEQAMHRLKNNGQNAIYLQIVPHAISNLDIINNSNELSKIK